MKYSCLHTHTEFCDGSGSVEDYCRAAFDKGFVSLGFSAHAPLPGSLGIQSNWHVAEKNLDAYLAAVDKAKQKWRGKLDVYAGLEVDFIRDCSGPSDALYQNLNLDYIIGSVHCVLPPGCDVHWAESFTGSNKLLCIDGSPQELELIIDKGFHGDAQKLVEAYYNDVIAMCSAGGFSILAHADLIVKNNGGERFFSVHDNYYSACIARLCAALAGSNIVVEVNTGGLNRRKTDAPYPSPAMLKLMHQQGIPATINADAHTPEHLDGFYDTARAALQSAGYTSFMLFASGSDGAGCWQEESLDL